MHDAMGARGRFRRPLDPSRAERRPRDFFAASGGLAGGLQASAPKTAMRGADELPCRGGRIFMHRREYGKDIVLIERIGSR